MLPPVTDNRRHLQRLLTRIFEQLAAAYGTPEALLGNQDEPLDEAVFVILTFQTDIPRAQAVWARLRSRYPTWEQVEGASEEEIAEQLRDGGLHRQKARTIKRLLARVREDMGELSLSSLARLSDEDAESLLRRLPGLSFKGARCVMLYSFGRSVFPVDINTFRILRRIGVIPEGVPYRRRTLHDELQAMVKPGIRRGLHVNMVIHGQRVCLPQQPRCAVCPIRGICKQKGVSEESAVHFRRRHKPGGLATQ